MSPKSLFKGIFLAAALVFGLSTVAAAQMALDLDLAPGDQGVRETTARPGEMKAIELVALKGAKDLIGFEIELAFDEKQVTFKGFNPGGLMAGAVPITRTKDGGAIISAALLGKTSKGESGSFGQILVELGKELSGEVEVKLVKGSYGAQAGTKSFPLEGSVKFLGPGAASKVVPATAQPPKAPGQPGMQQKPAPSTVTPPPGKPGEAPEPPECDENVRNSELKPQAENVPCGGSSGNLIFRTVCNKSPYDQAAITLPEGRMAGCFGVESITKNRVVWGIRVEGGRSIYHSSLGKAALKRLKLTDKRPSRNGKYTIYLDTRRSDPNARVTVRFVDHPVAGPPAAPPPPGGPPAGPPPGPRPGPPMGPPPGAAAEDPNEPNIPDGKDFQRLEIAQDGDMVRVRINTYDNWAFRGFQSLYFKGGEKDQVHIKLTGKQFEIFGQNPKARGLFDNKLFEGEAVLEGKQYVLKFPWSEVFGNSPEVEAWIYSQDGRDRVPDGRGTLKVQRGAVPPAGPMPPAARPGGFPPPSPGQQMALPPGGPPMGPQPDPEEIIKTLPSALQPIYKQTLGVEQKTAIAHLKAELELQESIFKTLGATRMILSRATGAEKEKIARALVFFAHRGPEGPPGGPPMGPPPGKPGRGPAPPAGQRITAPPGGPPMGPPEDMVQRMIEETQRRIAQIKKKLAEMQGGAM